MEGKIQGSKGPGNGKTLFLNFQGEERPIDEFFKWVPLAEHYIRDDFDKIVTATEREILSSHGVPWQLLGVIVDDAKAENLINVVKIFNEFTLRPIHKKFRIAINSAVPPNRRIDFDRYSLDAERTE